ELGRHPGLLEAEPLGRARRDLELNVPARAPAGDQLIKAEILETNQLEPVDLLETRSFDRVGRDCARAVRLQVEERIDDRERDFVPECRRANGVAIDQNGHAPEVNEACAARCPALSPY